MKATDSASSSATARGVAAYPSSCRSACAISCARVLALGGGEAPPDADETVRRRALAVGLAGEVGVLHAVTATADHGLQPLEGAVGVVAGQPAAHLGQRLALGLLDVPDPGHRERRDPRRHARRLSRLTLAVLGVLGPPSQHGGEDGQPALAAPHLAAEFLPGPVSRDPRAARSLQLEEQRVREGVGVEARLRTEP